MNAKQSSLVVKAFVLALTSATIASILLFVNWLQWQVSIQNLGSGYDIDIVSKTFNTSRTYSETDILSLVAKISTSRGECWWGDITTEASDTDRLSEKTFLRMFYICTVVSYVIMFLTLLNLVYWRWKRYFTLTLVGLAGFAGIFMVIRFLSPKSGLHLVVPPQTDFDCHFNIILNISSVSVTPIAGILLSASIILSMMSAIMALSFWRKRSLFDNSIV